MKVTLVVPTIRPERMLDFLNRWKPHIEGVSKIIICEDNPESSSQLREADFADIPTDLYAWDSIDADLGENAWIIPRRNAGIRSYGYWKAWAEEADLIVTLDDDCFPHGDGFIEGHCRNLSQRATLGWETTSDVMSRGFPYKIREASEVVVSHGLWENILDLDAPTALVNCAQAPALTYTHKIIPYGSFFPMCGMNLAFSRLIAPAMYFLLMGKDEPFDRFDDIWAGLFVKKICDHLELAVVSGAPVVWHSRLSDMFDNLQKEASGIKVHEDFWRHVRDIQLTGRDVVECYHELADSVSGYEAADHPEYFRRLGDAMHVWAKLFEGAERETRTTDTVFGEPAK